MPKDERFHIPLQFVAVIPVMFAIHAPEDCIKTAIAMTSNRSAGALAGSPAGASALECLIEPRRRMPNHCQALWEFHVKLESISAFERTYGPTGAWAQLFRQSPDYLGTDLIRDLD